MTRRLLCRQAPLSNPSKLAEFCRVLALAATTACMTRSSRPPLVADQQWHLRENASRGTYHMAILGSANDIGSTVSIRADSAPSTAYGQAEYGMPIRAGSAQRISVAAEVRPQNVDQRAVLWVSAMRNGQPLVTEYAQIPARGTSDWQRQETGLVVPDSASSIGYGVFLQGPGEVSIRHYTAEATQLSPPGTASSASARAELDSALYVARAYSLWRDTVTWPVVEERVRRAAAGAGEARDVYPAIRLLVRALGDHHSSVYTPHDMVVFRSGANIPTTEVHAIAGGVGYVNSPGYLAEHHDSTLAYVRRTYAALRSVASTSPCGWVVDLRRNTGGTPEPMLAALAPFFAVDVQANVMQPALHQVGITAPGDLPALTRAAVAVLLGPQTGSAGERVALAFRERPRTRSFGQRTNGVATVRRFVLLPDGGAIAITTSLMDSARARNNSQSIVPDVAVADRAGRGDPSLSAASEWVAATGCAAAQGGTRGQSPDSDPDVPI